MDNPNMYNNYTLNESRPQAQYNLQAPNFIESDTLSSQTTLSPEQMQSMRELPANQLPNPQVRQRPNFTPEPGYNPRTQAQQRQIHKHNQTTRNIRTERSSNIDDTMSNIVSHAQNMQSQPQAFQSSPGQIPQLKQMCFDILNELADIQGRTTKAMNTVKELSNILN